MLTATGRSVKAHSLKLTVWKPTKQQATECNILLGELFLVVVLKLAQVEKKI